MNDVRTKPLRPGHTSAAVLDGGSQFTAHVVRGLRAKGCDAVIFPKNTPFETLLSGKFDLVVASGGPADINEEDSAERIDRRLMDGTTEMPFLGICLGFHELVVANGGSVTAYEQREVTVETITVDSSYSVFDGLESSQEVQMNHGLSSKKEDIPKGFNVIATSGLGDSTFVAGISDEDGRRVAFQYHPEVRPTVNGLLMLENFLRKNCGLKCDFVPEDFRAVAAKKIAKAKASGQKVLLGFSGGVDSTVTAAMLHESIGDKLVALHIDTGFNRKGEAEQARRIAKQIGFKLEVVDASEVFQNATKYFTPDKIEHTSPTKLKDTYDYFIERLIFSATYGQVIKDALGRLGLSPENSYLAQGTLYTDIIESGHSGKSTATIKPHHNIGDAFTAWEKAGKLVAPLDRFFKDDVRTLGSELGLADSSVWRQPFPGPGLMVRVINLDKAPEFANFDKVNSQLNAFRTDDDSVHILPLRATGNPGDGPEYKHLVAISSDDGLQDRHYKLAKEIPKNVRAIGGVVYIEGGKTPQEINVYDRVIPTDLSTKTMNFAREVDSAIEKVSVAFGLNRTLAQEPVAISAFNPYGTKGRLVLLRPVDTIDFFTASASRPGSKTFPLESYHAQTKAALGVEGVGAVGLDLTDKPPRTVEYK